MYPLYSTMIGYTHLLFTTLTCLSTWLPSIRAPTVSAPAVSAPTVRAPIMSAPTVSTSTTGVQTVSVPAVSVPLWKAEYSELKFCCACYFHKRKK